MSDLAVIRWKEVRLTGEMEVFRKRLWGWNDIDAVPTINGLQIIAAVDGGGTNLLLIPWARIAYCVRGLDPVAEAKADAVAGMLAPAVPTADGGEAVEVPEAAIADIRSQVAKKGKRR
ncbi:MAG TPA: hypothetical protein VNG35_16480 [Gemmatimonadales bacterium]|nr:hypothetical protein [Gemmatimonadales bacterium]